MNIHIGKVTNEQAAGVLGDSIFSTDGKNYWLGKIARADVLPILGDQWK